MPRSNHPTILELFISCLSAGVRFPREAFLRASALALSSFFFAAVKGNVDHVPFESGSDDADDCNELLAGLEDLLEIVSGLENVRSVTSSQTAAKKNEDRARAEALRNASLGNLTAADTQLIKSSGVDEVELSSAKKQPPNNPPSEILCIFRQYFRAFEAQNGNEGTEGG